MMKISIDGKELKGIIEKVSYNMGKDGYLSKIMLYDNGNELYTSVMKNFESYLSIYTDNYTSLNCLESKLEMILFDYADLKLLLNMKDEVIIEETTENILIQNKWKIIKLIKYDIICFPNFSEFIVGDDKTMLKFKESEFQEIISNFSKIANNSNLNKVLQSINFNIDDNRIESLDGQRIIVRQIAEEEKISENGKIQIDVRIEKDLKKVLNKKSSANITIVDSDSTIRITGTDFMYIQKKKEKEFFNINNFFTNDYDFSFCVDTQKMLEHIKYYTDNVIKKNGNHRALLFNISDTITTYAKNEHFEVSNKLEITNFKGKEKDLTIAFNPYFILDALKIADDTEIHCTVTGSKAPLMIYANKYSFLILPIKVKDELKAQLQEILDNEK